MSGIQDNVDRLVDQMQDLLQTLQEVRQQDAKEDVSWKNVLTQVLRLKNKVQELANQQRKILDSRGIPSEKTSEVLNQITRKGGAQGKTVQRLKEMEEEAFKSYEEMQHEIKEYASVAKRLQMELKDEKYQKVQQKQKYINLGGKKNWKPL